MQRSKERNITPPEMKNSIVQEVLPFFDLYDDVLLCASEESAYVHTHDSVCMPASFSVFMFALACLCLFISLNVCSCVYLHMFPFQKSIQHPPTQTSTSARSHRDSSANILDFDTLCSSFTPPFPSLFSSLYPPHAEG